MIDFENIKKVLSKAGREIAKKASALIYCLKDQDTPLTVKAIILGNLTYLINPVDAIPDLLGPIGYTDDLTLITATIVTYAIYIKDKHWEDAERFVSRLFD